MNTAPVNGSATWRAALQYLERSVPSPELRAKRTPRFTFGCKRVLISNDYYPALLRPNVELVTTAIREVTKGGIVTSNGERHALDAIILGTGFQAAEAMAPFAVHGREGLDLSQRWNTRSPLSSSASNASIAAGLVALPHGIGGSPGCVASKSAPARPTGAVLTCGVTAGPRT